MRSASKASRNSVPIRRSTTDCERRARDTRSSTSSSTAAHIGSPADPAGHRRAGTHGLFHPEQHGQLLPVAIAPCIDTAIEARAQGSPSTCLQTREGSQAAIGKEPRDFHVIVEPGWIRIAASLWRWRSCSESRASVIVQVPGMHGVPPDFAPAPTDSFDRTLRSSSAPCVCCRAGLVLPLYPGRPRLAPQARPPRHPDRAA